MRRAVPTELQNECGASDVYIEVRSCASSARTEHTTPVSCINWHNALFLDRDGVINVDRGYIHRSNHVPGIFELARFWTNELQWLIVVVTNQSGIGRGYFDESTMKTSRDDV
jgi:hypothetical protein